MNLLITGATCTGKTRLAKELVDLGLYEPWRYYALNEIRTRYSDGSHSGEYLAWSMFLRAAQSEESGVFEFSDSDGIGTVFSEILAKSPKSWKIIYIRINIQDQARLITKRDLDKVFPPLVSRSKRSLFKSGLIKRRDYLDLGEVPVLDFNSTFIDVDKTTSTLLNENLITWIKSEEANNCEISLTSSLSSLDKDNSLEIISKYDSDKNLMNQAVLSLAGSDKLSNAIEIMINNIIIADNPLEAYESYRACGLLTLLIMDLRSFESKDWLNRQEYSKKLIERFALSDSKTNVSDAKEVMLLFSILQPHLVEKSKYPSKINRQVRDQVETLEELIPFINDEIISELAKLVVGMRLVEGIKTQAGLIPPNLIPRLRSINKDLIEINLNNSSRFKSCLRLCNKEEVLTFLEAI